MQFNIGLLLFPEITQLDLIGPYEVFTRFPDAKVHLIAKTLDPVRCSGGMRILPDTTMADCPALDLIFVPGGSGMNPLMDDAETLAFLRRRAMTARYITSVCSGALVLGAAGLLQGKRSAAHWMSLQMLSLFGAIPVAERVVKDGNLITGGGVTAGIDCALAVASEAFGEEVARSIQLAIEYAPEPPYSPESIRRARVAGVVKSRRASMREDAGSDSTMRHVALGLA